MSLQGERRDEEETYWSIMFGACGIDEFDQIVLLDEIFVGSDDAKTMAERALDVIVLHANGLSPTNRPIELRETDEAEVRDHEAPRP